MSMAAEVAGLSDDEITAYIADPATIPTHEVAREVIDCLDAEIANIQAQVDAVMVEANVRPLSEERQSWVKRASYAAAMRKNSRQRVYQRDKELRGLKGPAVMEPKHSKEEKLLKQQRLMVEAETRREAKRLATIEANNRAATIAQQRRELAASLNFAHQFYKVASAKLAPELLAELQEETHKLTGNRLSPLHEDGQPIK